MNKKPDSSVYRQSSNPCANGRRILPMLSTLNQQKVGKFNQHLMICGTSSLGKIFTVKFTRKESLENWCVLRHFSLNCAHIEPKQRWRSNEWSNLIIIIATGWKNLSLFYGVFLACVCCSKLTKVNDSCLVQYPLKEFPETEYASSCWTQLDRNNCGS